MMLHRGYWNLGGATTDRAPVYPRVSGGVRTITASVSADNVEASRVKPGNSDRCVVSTSGSPARPITSWARRSSERLRRATTRSPPMDRLPPSADSLRRLARHRPDQPRRAALAYPSSPQSLLLRAVASSATRPSALTASAASPTALLRTQQVRRHPSSTRLRSAALGSAAVSLPHPAPLLPGRPRVPEIMGGKTSIEARRASNDHPLAICDHAA